MKNINKTKMAIKLQTVRFTYSNEFINELEYFSKIHQYDDRKTFKEAWISWKNQDNIKRLIEIEMSKSEKNEYKGDLMDKIYKSTRYYYRKKNFIHTEEQEEEENDENDKNEYTGFSKSIIKIMDRNIYELIETNRDKTKISRITPAKAFITFCNTHLKEITAEIYRLKEKNILDPREISLKFKKAYKNRFYKIKMTL